MCLICLGTVYTFTASLEQFLSGSLTLVSEMMSLDSLALNPQLQGQAANLGLVSEKIELGPRWPTGEPIQKFC